MKNLLCLVLFLIVGGLLQAQRIPDNTFVVRPYLQFSTQTSIYVLWETRKEATSLVRFGEARALVQQAVLDRQATLPGYRSFHEVLLDDLKPETNYFWQVITATADGDTLKSPVYTFKTAVRDNSAFMFALVGDTQRNDRTPWAWGKIAERIWQDRPNFVVHAGDVVDQGFRKTDWIEDFFPNGHILMSRMPIYTVLGNHEQDSPLYYQYMVAPKPEYYYTFTYGNVQFFMIDSNRDLSEGSEQYEWLEWELARSKAPWKIAIHHHPPYSSDSDDHGNTAYESSTLGSMTTRNLVPLYERYGLDFCLFGHTHLYERSWPIKDDMINMKDGVVYINSGGAGGGLEDFAPTRSWFTLELQSVHHYCTFAVFEKNLVFKAIDHEGRLMDAFQMQKDQPGQEKATVVQPPAAHILADATLFEQQTTVRLEAAFPDLEIRYTLDGSEPTRTSPLYTQPLTIQQSAKLSTRTYTRDGLASRLNSIQLRKMAPQAPAKVKTSQKGLKYVYYEGTWHHLPDFKTLQAVRTGTCNQLSLAETGHRDDQFALVMEGYVELPKTGKYTFFINSDDGSRLYINEELVIDHDGDHSAIKKTGQLILGAGKHRIRVEYFENSGGQFLQAGIIDEQMGVLPFTPFQLSH